MIIPEGKVVPVRLFIYILTKPCRSSDEGRTSKDEFPSLQSPPLTPDEGSSSPAWPWPLDRPFQDQVGYARTSEANTLSGLYEVSLQ